MPFIVRSRRPGAAELQRIEPGAAVIDVSSRGPAPWSRLSPFFPHGGIPVPFVPGVTAHSVEGIWQGLLVFERVDVDTSRFAMRTQRGLKRASRVLGAPLGHRAGLGAEAPLLDLAQARAQIFLPSYHWVLTHCVASELAALRALGATSTVVLLDFAARGRVDDPVRPQPHAELLARFLDGRWPAAAA